MRDLVWIRGMAQLRACCKDRDLDADMESERSACYRRDLGHLSDAQWLWVCEQARKQEWFPSINDLLELAQRAPVDAVRAQERLLARVDQGEQSSRVTPPLPLYEALVAEYPRRADEGAMAYIVRLAEKAGIPQGGKRGEWPVGDEHAVGAK